MNQYEKTTEKKKQAIMNAALDLFNKKGFSGGSIKEIAALAQVSQVSIYNYFGSKEALVAACAERIMRDTLAKSREILTRNISYAERLQLALALCTENISLSVSACFSDLALRDPALMGLLTKNINEKKMIIYRDYIEAGKQEKVIDNTIPTEIYLSFCCSLDHMGSILDFNEDAAATLAQIHHLFLYGLIGKS